MFVPVVDRNQQPLMPTTPSRAQHWARSGKATPFWKHGVFCVRLNVDPSDRKTQKVAVGVDPGSKKEGFTIKSAAHTYLNLQADAVTWVKSAMKTRREMRKTRRSRKTPYRQPRPNRSCKPKWLAPSTKARWQWKLRILNWLQKMYPVTCVVVEDIKAVTKKKARRWNVSFSPLEIGKNWFYQQVKTTTRLETKPGFETKELRDTMGLKKSKNKISNKFEAHCVDSWVLANWWTRGHIRPDNTEMLLISPLRFHRRQLHVFRPTAGDIRKRYGSTRSLGFKRGSLIKHIKYGIAYVGGCTDNRITLHNSINGERVSRDIKPSDCKFLTFSSWRARAA